MNSPSNANRKSILSWWHFIVLFLLLSGLLWIFFPKNFFIKSIVSTEKPSLLSVSYLKNLVEKNPDNLEWKILLAEQEISIGKLDEAKAFLLPWVSMTPNTPFQWKVLWLYYRITREEAFALKENSEARLLKMKTLKILATKLSESQDLKPKEKLMLASDALAMEMPAVANFLYQETLLKSKDSYSPHFFAKAGSTALFAKDYEHAATFYLIAMERSVTQDDKRRYFLKAIDSLIKTGDPKRAFTVARKNIDGLEHDKTTNIFMAKLAINAGEQKIAEHYVNFLIQIRYQDIDNDKKK